MASGDKQRHPPGLYVLFGTEAAERFSFYTMRALLVLYLTTIILPVMFRESDSYRKDLDETLRERPAATFKEVTRDISKEENAKLEEAMVGLDPALKGLKGDALVAAQADYFAKAIERQPDDVSKIVTDAFAGDRVKPGEGQEKLFEQAMANLGTDQRGFVDWVVSLKIKRDIRDHALSVYGLYLLLVYLSGLLGGALSDKILGSRKAILAGGIVMGVGLFTMWWPSLIYYGLALIIAGNGFFKPNISTIVSGLYPEGDKRRDPAFTIFYMGINLGAMLAIFGAGYAEGLAGDHSWGWNIGFVIAGVGMIISLILFLAGQKHLGTAGFPPGREVDENSRLLPSDFRDILTWAAGITVVVLVFMFLWNQVIGQVWGSIPLIGKLAIGAGLVLAGVFGVFGRKNPNVAETKPLTREEWQQVAVIAILSLFVIFFWAGFEQAGGTMNLFAYEQTNRHIGGWEMPATWFQGFNPLFIILLAPIFTVIWGWNDRKSWGLSTPGKMGWGMIVLGLGFVLMYFGQQVADEQGQASLLWLVGVYFLHTLGELCLSPIGLSMVTRLSPVRIVSLMMGVWFACTAVADYLSGQLERITHAFDLNLWAVLISTSMGAGVVLLALTPMLKKWMHGKA